ncbi:hypothetical protein DTX79_02815 [Bacilli bacterium]|nr:hypothetical protein DTX79_02815 [Bacilli bacterium]
MRITKAFDADSSKVGKDIDGVPIFHVSDLEEELENIRVVILTVPASEAEEIAEKLVNLGVNGILNFTPARITVPSHVRVHHIDLAVELQSLVYFLKHYPLEKE